MDCQVIGCREHAPWSYEYHDASGLRIEIHLCRRHERDLLGGGGVRELRHPRRPSPVLSARAVRDDVPNEAQVGRIEP